MSCIKSRRIVITGNWISDSLITNITHHCIQNRDKTVFNITHKLYTLIGKYLKNLGLKHFLLYNPIMKDLIIIPTPFCKSMSSLFTHLKQHIVTSFQIENGLYCLNKVNSNRQLRGYPRFISFCSRCMLKLLHDFIFVYHWI